MLHNNENEFIWQTEQFADIRILRYQTEGFDQLSLQHKIFIWYLYNAALCGRDIIYDQNYKYNLLVRKTLEAIYLHYRGDRNNNEWDAFLVYLKRIWFSNGIHHHYSMEKFTPEFSESFFKQAYFDLQQDKLPLAKNMDAVAMYNVLHPVIFNPCVDSKRVNLTANADIVATSACNFYEGVTQAEVEAFYASKIQTNDKTPVSLGLNKKLIKTNGHIKELDYKSDGLYGKAIRKIVIWLEKAKVFAENELQKETIEKLIQFYETGCLKTFDEYSILWTKDNQSEIDFVNGFIEVYGDPLGYHGSWQSMVSMRDENATQRFGLINDLAAWCENQSPIAAEYKCNDAKVMSYKVIQVVVQAGDNAPSSPIGVNLPNADWIRETYGSKSVSLGNIEDAYEMASKSTGSIQEFYLPEQQQRAIEFGHIASKIHTALHEVIGHGSGKLAQGVGTPKETLKSYANTIEEARADLVALYFITDQKLIDVGLISSIDVGKTAYDSYILFGLMRQLVRVEPNQQLEESHMRNRQLIAKWVFEKGSVHNVIEKIVIDNKTFFRINDYNQLRLLFGELLIEVQRIKSEGDFSAAQLLVENYGVSIDKSIHDEVLIRWKKLNIAPFAGFIQPKLNIEKHNNRITNVIISYPDNFAQQMMYYAQNYACLPLVND